MLNTAKFTPTGHRRPVHRPREYEQPTQALEDIFSYYLDVISEEKMPGVYIGHIGYEKASELIGGLAFTLEDVNALLALRGRNLQEQVERELVGAFFSACYNKLPDKEIILDVDTNVCGLCYELAENKVFVNKGIIDGYLANWDAKGVIINYGEITDSTLTCKGLIINLGKAMVKPNDKEKPFVLFWYAADAKSNPVQSDYRRVINMEEQQYREKPDLVEYIESLKEEPKDAATIKDDLRTILRRYNYEL